MDDVDNIVADRVLNRSVKVHVAAAYAIRRPETRDFVQRCEKCGRALRTFQENQVVAFCMRSDAVEKFALPAGTLIAITRDAQYVVQKLGVREEFCS